MSWSPQNHVFWADRAIQVQSRDRNDLPGEGLIDEGGLDSMHTDVDTNHDMHDISGQTGNDPLRVAEVRVIGSVM